MSTSGEHRRNPVFWIAFVTMLAIFVYSGAWLMLDLLMKLGITPQALDAEAEATSEADTETISEDGWRFEVWLRPK